MGIELSNVNIHIQYALGEYIRQAYIHIEVNKPDALLTYKT